MLDLPEPTKASGKPSDSREHGRFVDELSQEPFCQRPLYDESVGSTPASHRKGFLQAQRAWSLAKRPNLRTSSDLSFNA